TVRRPRTAPDDSQGCRPAETSTGPGPPQPLAFGHNRREARKQRQPESTKTKSRKTAEETAASESEEPLQRLPTTQQTRGAPRLRRGVSERGGLGGPFEAPHLNGLSHRGARRERHPALFRH